MGCVVNGPGEASHADLGIAAGKKRGHLFIKGEIVRVVKEEDMVEALVEEAKKIVAEGVEARLAARDVGRRRRGRSRPRAVARQSWRRRQSFERTHRADSKAHRALNDCFDRLAQQFEGASWPPRVC